MTVLSVASKANPAAVLPAILAAAFAVSVEPWRDIAVDYRHADSLIGNTLVELRTENGDTVTDASIMTYLDARMSNVSSGKSHAVSPMFLLV